MEGHLDRDVSIERRRVTFSRHVHFGRDAAQASRFQTRSPQRRTRVAAERLRWHGACSVSEGALETTLPFRLAMENALEGIGGCVVMTFIERISRLGQESSLSPLSKSEHSPFEGSDMALPHDRAIDLPAGIRLW